MRIALVYFPVKGPEGLTALAKSMARALEAKGHFVDVTQARPDETPRLTGYDYIIVGTESATAFGKISPKISQILSQAGMIAGRRSMAFLRKSGFRSAKALARLMKAMEGEGMLVNCSEIVANEAEAAEAAKSAPIERY
jgi:hypothetical protein